MNLFISTGRLCNDPENHTKGEKSHVTFNLAVQREFSKPDEPDCDYFRCVCFNKNKNFILEYLRKGMKVELYGRLRTDTYDKEGVPVRTQSYIIEQVGFAESKEANEKYLRQATEEKYPDELPTE